MDEEDENALWRTATQDVEILQKQKSLSGEVKPEPKRRIAEVKQRKTSKEASVQEPMKRGPKGDGIDRATSEKLRKGQIPIEARLDLHGMTQAQAQPALEDFMRRSHGAGKRCVLVITGKGPGPDGRRDPLVSRQGILKRRVPEWLSEASIKPLVLKTSPARAKHGGEGALYVLLRRQR